MRQTNDEKKRIKKLQEKENDNSKSIHGDNKNNNLNALYNKTGKNS